MTRTPAAMLLLLVACATSSPPPAAVETVKPTPPVEAKRELAPVAKKEPHVRELHGEAFTDNYFWLRNKGTPEVEAYLNAEEAWAQKQLAPLKPLAETLYAETISHIAEDDSSPPAKHRGFEYWSRVEAGKQYSVFLRRKAPKGADEVILDVNELGRGKKYIGLGALEVSDDTKTLLYSTDETGFRQYTLQVKDLEKGTLLPDRIERTVGVTWAADSKTIFYTVENDAKRPYRVYRHVLGTAPTTDALVYEEKDERFELSLARSMSERYVIIAADSKLSSEVRVIDASKPQSAPMLIEPRADDRKYDVDDDGVSFLIRTNDSGRNYRLVTAPFTKPGRANWKELVAHDDAVMLEGATPFKGRVVLSVRRAGLPELEVLDLKTKRRDRIVLPEAVHSVWVGDNRELDTPTFRYVYQTFTTPTSWFSYDFASKQSALIKETPVPGGFDRSRYESERLEATTKDGTKVPISIVSKKGVPRDGTAPLLLEAYGSYGFPYPISFSPAWLPLLDRGVIVAIAHIRGGGELGKAWHEHGRLAEKMNTFTDFIACAEQLVADHHTSPRKLVIHGGSAGGLLMGAVTNLRPDLFQAVINDVPFVDVINTMNDPSLPLTVTEYEEWGNPTKREEYGWMRAYSPYDNLEPKAYPAMLVRSSYNDSQVMYFEPAKYVARMRALKTDSRPLYFHIRMEPAGHGGKSGRYERYREQAEAWSFALWQQGLGPIPAQ